MENCPRDQLQRCFESWINQQQKDLDELNETLCDEEARRDEDKLRSMTQKNIKHFEEYHDKRLGLLRHDPPSTFTPTWCTPFENSFLWISGCRPTQAIQIVYTMCGSELEAHLNEFLQGVRRGHMGELSSGQLGLVNELHVKTVKKEEELSNRLTRLQEDIGEHQLGLLMILEGGDRVDESNGYVNMSSNGDGSEVDQNDEHDGHEDELGSILEEADRLRLETLKELIRILSPLQAADFFVASKKLCLSMHEWGTKRRESINPDEFRVKFDYLSTTSCRGIVFMEEIAKTEPKWTELLGSNQWEGLMEPLNIDLRKLILRCGDFCQATYDAFNNDEHSKYCGSSRYGKKALLEKVSFDSAKDYFVDTFLYATAKIGTPQAFLLHSLSREAWDRESNWIGYIAVSTDEVSKALGRREIYVVLRGTLRNLEWMDVFDAKPVSVKPLLKKPQVQSEHHHWYDAFIGSQENVNSSDSDDEDDDNTMKVMKGWLTIYISDNPNSQFTKLSARTQILTKLNELVNRYKDENPSIIYTGHSLGASLSVLSAFDLVENGLSDIPVAAFIFGLPQVGNKAFNEKLKAFPNLRIMHIKNVIDLIIHYPSQILGYAYSGINLEIDSRKSTSLKDSKNPSDWHNLQAMLHVVAGWNGKGGEFELKVKRSIALVNKSCDFLKDECLVPASWWVERNKGMVLNEDGDWVIAPPTEEDIPVPEF